MRRPVLALTPGDPAGVGPEVLVRACLTDPPGERAYTPVVFGDLALIDAACVLTGVDPGCLRPLDPAGPWDVAESDLGVVQVGPAFKGLRPGIVDPAYGRASFEWVEAAIGALKAGRADAMVTGPICKESWAAAGIGYPGHTELLSERFGRDAVMLMAGPRLRVALLTTHVPLATACAMITEDLVVRSLRILRDSLVRDFGVERPRIGLAGLNPHAGEGGRLGDEELRSMIPAAQRLREEGMDIVGPEPADGLFPRAIDRGFDAVACPTHDQALIPFKMLHFRDGVNLTIGIDAVRTSPVHGTGFDIAHAGAADPGSFRAAIALAAYLARRRKAE